MRAWAIPLCLLVASCGATASERVARPERVYVPTDTSAQVSEPAHPTIGGKGRSVDATVKEFVARAPEPMTRTAMPRPRPPPR
jgi:hypothetical protein